MSDGKAEREVAACKKKYSFFLLFRMTFGLRPSWVFFISDLASCLPKDIYQYLCHPLNGHLASKKHQAGVKALS